MQLPQKKGLFKKSEKYRRETHNPFSSRLLFSFGTQFVTPSFSPPSVLFRRLPLPPPFLVSHFTQSCFSSPVESSMVSWAQSETFFHGKQ